MQNAPPQVRPVEKKSDTSHRTISPDLSEKLTAVSFLASAGVVLIHAYPPYSKTVQSDISVFFERLLSLPFTLWAVPVFFVISGYLFAVKTDLGQMPNWYSTILKKRFKSILIPYFLWCIIYVVAVGSFRAIGNIHGGRPMLLYTGLNEPLFSLRNLSVIFGLDLTRPPVAGVLWYLRNLMLLFLISPMFMFFMKRRRTAVPCLLFFLTVFGVISCISREIVTTLWAGFQIQSFFFFQLGMFFAFYPPIRETDRTIRVILPVFWLIVVFAAAWLVPVKDSLVFARILLWLSALTGVGAIWVLPDLFPALRRIGRWSVAKDSFFIYLFHCIILAIATCPSVEKMFETKLHVPVFGLYSIRFLIPFFLSLLTAEILKRFLPKVYRSLIGGR